MGKKGGRAFGAPPHPTAQRSHAYQTRQCEPSQRKQGSPRHPVPPRRRRKARKGQPGWRHGRRQSDRQEAPARRHQRPRMPRGLAAGDGSGGLKFSKKKAGRKRPAFNLIIGVFFDSYIMSLIPPPMPGVAGAFSSFFSTTTQSVVRIMPAMEAAFSRATRTTLVGSITPAAYIFSYFSV